MGRNVFGREDGITAFEEWLAGIGLNLRLRDLGCGLDKANEIGDLALKVWDFRLHPTQADVRLIAQIYRDAW
jgi:alcohol dehydrogenase class IV